MIPHLFCISDRAIILICAPPHLKTISGRREQHSPIPPGTCGTARRHLPAHPANERGRRSARQPRFRLPCVGARPSGAPGVARPEVPRFQTRRSSLSGPVGLRRAPSASVLAGAGRLVPLRFSAPAFVPPDTECLICKNQGFRALCAWKCLLKNSPEHSLFQSFNSVLFILSIAVHRRSRKPGASASRAEPPRELAERR